MMRRIGAGVLWLALVLLSLAGCGNSESWPDRFPGENAVPGWSPASEVQEFDTGNLYDLVDGQADAFFAYGFESAYVRIYENGEGEQMRVELWRLDDPSNAYGLYTALRGGEPIAIGNDGDTDAGRRVDFWQDRALVRVFAVAPQDPATLERFAKTISGALPAGGERPPLIEQLPEEGLVVDSDLFFHQEVSMQGYLWLGGENLLSLGSETDAVLARYEFEDASAWLLLVEYLQDADASAALAALSEAGLENLGAAAVQGRMLGAVFGGLPNAQSERFLMSALDRGG
ncbi:MAG: DUF6599 family protein [Anaerolineae bacterium]|jgi:hypothetical protein